MARRKKITFTPREEKEMRQCVAMYRNWRAHELEGATQPQCVARFFDIIIKAIEDNDADISSLTITMYKQNEYTPPLEMYHKFYDRCVYIRDVLHRTTLTYTELSKITGISRPTLLSWINSGWLIGGKPFNVEDNIKFMQQM